MKRLIRFSIIFSALLVILIVILAVASYILSDKITTAAIKILNQKIAVKVESGETRLTFLKNFPRASVEFRNVVIFSSDGFDKSEFSGNLPDTLLRAENIVVDFNVADLVKRNYTIEGISVKRGMINLLSDSSGNVNYNIVKEEDKNTKSSDIYLNLKKILLSEMLLTYNNTASDIESKTFFTNSRMGSMFTSKDIDFSLNGNITVEFLKIGNFKLNDTLDTKISLRLITGNSEISINKSDIELNGYRFTVEGLIFGADSTNLSFAGSGIDIKSLISYLPEKIKQRLIPYDPSGTMNISGIVSGPLSNKELPYLNIDFNIKDGSVTYSESGLSATDLILEGTYAGPSSTFNNGGSLSVEKFAAKIGSGYYSGSFSLNSLLKPEIKLNLDGEFYPSELIRFFSVPFITSASGSAKIRVNLEGPFDSKKFTLNEVMLKLNPRISSNFSSLSFSLEKDNISFNNLRGQLDINSGNALLSNFGFGFRDHDFLVNGEMRNLSGWLAGKPENLIIEASALCRTLEPSKLSGSAGTNDSTKSKGINLPENILADIQFGIDNFYWRNFKASEINGSLSYKPGLINIKTIRMNTQEGSLDGTAFIYRNSDRTFMSKATFNLDNINISSTFGSFNNFGQDFIKAENISGSLSGSVSLLMPGDTLFRPIVKSLTTEGSFVIASGSLINFEPVMALSSFIEVSELERINFEELKNDFIIRNNAISFPEMEVNSSAADLVINGRHGFDNKYEYHIKVLLSEILSRKIRKPRPGTTEFGAVQDDGLGRTALLLRLEDIGKGLKISWDAKAAGKEIKKDIKAEKQTLKSILNEEYGWFKNDSSVKAETAGKKPPRFTITWDENDSTAVADTITKVKKETPLKNLFKKRLQ